MLSKKLHKVSPAQKRWAYNNIFDSYVYRKKDKNICFECNHEWVDEVPILTAIDGCTCPNCGRHLKTRADRVRSITQKYYYTVISVIGDYQVIRTFLVSHYCNTKRPGQYTMLEAYRVFMSSDGSVEVMSLKVQGLSAYMDQWVTHSDLSIARNPDHDRYHMRISDVYPRMKVLPILRRNGFKNDFHGVSPRLFFERVLTDNRCETLLKVGQYSLFRFFCRNSYYWKELWKYVKVCMRRGYVVPDADIWKDYIEMMRDQGMQMKNPDLICPANLNEEHDKLIRIRDMERLLDRQRNAEKNELAKQRREYWRFLPLNEQDELYKAEKGKFFDTKIQDNGLLIRPLFSVSEIIQESEIMEHCVYKNNYHIKMGSLLLTAIKGDEHLETIELDIEKMQLVQVHGHKNDDTPFHNTIKKLVESNMDKFRRARSKPSGEYIPPSLLPVPMSYLNL